MDETPRVRLRDQSGNRLQKRNGLVRIEPTGLDAIENRKALPEFSQHRWAPGRVEAGCDRTIDVFRGPGFELLMEVMEAAQKLHTGRSAPGLQSKEPRRRTFASYDINGRHRGPAKGYVDREVFGGRWILLQRPERLFEQAGGTIAAMCRSNRMPLAGHSERSVRD